MELFYRKYGVGPPVIIVHGLYGSSDNWVTIAKSLSENYEVFIVDQRNHGRSPHSDDFNYYLLKEDLREFMDAQGIERAVIIGHSMGGKTSMFFAKEYPERISRLIIIDIAPKSYIIPAGSNLETIDHKKIITSMQNIDFSQITSREEANDELAKNISSNRIRQFLLKNLERLNDGSYSWRINIVSLERNMNHILEGLNERDFEKGNGIVGFPVLFIRGADSDYIKDEDFVNIILKIFPYAELIKIPDAGHWVHAEQPELLLKNINYFINE